jgi:hypothetical protein
MSIGYVYKMECVSQQLQVKSRKVQCVLCGEFPVSFIYETGIEIITKIILILKNIET